MKIIDVRKKFKSSLKGLYPEEEIQTFFNWLLEEYTGLRPLDLAIHRELKLKEDQIDQFQKALRRLQKSEPIQYILGKTVFLGREFEVNNEVLIPRPETEELVQWIVEDYSKQLSSPVNDSILDIGTGSGCIAISLAIRLRKAQISAFDISEGALKLAEKNARKNKVIIDFQQRDILNMEDFSGEYDCIVSNPPYVRLAEKHQMQANVLDYEPHVALFVEDEDPLLFYREILNFARAHLKKKGMIYFEINEFLELPLKALLREQHFVDFEFRKDDYGKTRMLKIKN